ncbi:Mitochondrial NADH:ubiquinone oxidoreductase B14.7 subunit [Operophtera brumata]|uniref:NADH dehydrogenase [ubiquinone] 1 alpha subcomplex subunit 11 n=1 Tax=Operophtera brumata TaxID=104452 RepID=A0A0L7LJV9_OPEBR|nr:Mitochondrial NADH:ubiquinone oxidoreductase B14.7 subunit [Operophtera brumata]
MDRLLTYRYYDSPEGKDILLKTVATNKYAALAGLVYGSYDVLMYSRTVGVVNTVARYGFIIGPLVGMATAFTVTSNVAVNIRGKNDGLNYFMGGIVAGSIFSAWMKAPVLAVPAAMALGAAAVVKKTAIDAGYTFFPELCFLVVTNFTSDKIHHHVTILPDDGFLMDL